MHCWKHFLLKKEHTCTIESFSMLETFCQGCTDSRRPRTGWRDALLTLARSPATGWPSRCVELLMAIPFPQPSSLYTRRIALWVKKYQVSNWAGWRVREDLALGKDGMEVPVDNWLSPQAWVLAFLQAGRVSSSSTLRSFFTVYTTPQALFRVSGIYKQKL